MKIVKEISGRYRIAMENVVCFCVGKIKLAKEVHEAGTITQEELLNDIFNITNLLYLIFKGCPELFDELIEKSKNEYLWALKLMTEKNKEQK